MTCRTWVLEAIGAVGVGTGDLPDVTTAIVVARADEATVTIAPPINWEAMSDEDVAEMISAARRGASDAF